MTERHDPVMLSELIEMLQQIQEQHGDLHIVGWNDGASVYWRCTPPIVYQTRRLKFSRIQAVTPAEMPEKIVAF